MPTRSTATPGDTKTRLLDAAEALFIDAGYEAMSMRLITARADANLAAVNYHFGSKDALIHAMLTRRLDGLNQNRLALLERFQLSLGPQLTCEHILGAMFIPALQQSRARKKRSRAAAPPGPRLCRSVTLHPQLPARNLCRRCRTLLSRVSNRPPASAPRRTRLAAALLHRFALRHPRRCRYQPPDRRFHARPAS